MLIFTAWHTLYKKQHTHFKSVRKVGFFDNKSEIDAETENICNKKHEIHNLYSNS